MNERDGLFGAITDVMDYLDAIDYEEAEIVKGYFFNGESVGDLSKWHDISKSEVKEILKRHFFQINGIYDTLIHESGIESIITEYIYDMRSPYIAYGAYEFFEDCKSDIDKMAHDISEQSEFMDEENKKDYITILDDYKSLFITSEQAKKYLQDMLKEFNKISKNHKITEYYE